MKEEPLGEKNHSQESLNNESGVLLKPVGSENVKELVEGEIPSPDANKETLGEKELYMDKEPTYLQVKDVKEKVQEFIRELKDELYVSFIKYYQLHGASKQTMNNIIDKLALEIIGEGILK